MPERGEVEGFVKLAFRDRAVTEKTGSHVLSSR